MNLKVEFRNLVSMHWLQSSLTESCFTMQILFSKFYLKEIHKLMLSYFIILARTYLLKMTFATKHEIRKPKDCDAKSQAPCSREMDASCIKSIRVGPTELKVKP